MKKFKIWNSLLFIIVIAFLLISSCKKDEPVVVHDFGNFTDPRDGHVYKTIEIGSQTWFAENLACEDVGREITDITEWKNNAAFDGWCYYENDKATYGSTYGILYQWEVAKEACPTGWHLPANAEWDILRDYLGGYSSSAGGKLKETGTAHWNSPNEGATNETGFTALPGGAREHNVFSRIGRYGFWWCSTEYNTGLGWGWSMNHNGSNLRNFNGFHEMHAGLSVRCLKD